MKNFTKENKFPVFFLIALLGIFMAHGAVFGSTGYSGGKIFTILILGLSLFLNIEQSYYLVIFCLPLSNILKLSAGSFTIIPFLYAIIILKLLLLKGQKMKVVSLASFVFLMIFQVFSIVFYQASLVGVISFILNCFFVLYSASYFFNEKDCNQNMLKNASLMFAISTALNVLISDLFPNSLRFINQSQQAILESSDRYGALFVEPNEFSQLVLVAVGFLVATISLYKTKLGRVGVVALMIYLIINGARSISKSYVLTLFALFCFLVLIVLVRFFKKKKHSALAFIGVFFVFVLGIVGGYFIIYDVIIPVFESRVDSADLLTGRGDIWMMYIDAILRRSDVLLIGCGAGNVTGVLSLAEISADAVPHNVYLEYLVQFGMIGIGSILICWSDAFRSMRRKPVWFLIPTFAFLITAVGISANSNDCIFILMVLLSMPYVKTDKRETPIEST